MYSDYRKRGIGKSVSYGIPVSFPLRLISNFQNLTQDNSRCLSSKSLKIICFALGIRYMIRRGSIKSMANSLCRERSARSVIFINHQTFYFSLGRRKCVLRERIIFLCDGALWQNACKGLRTNIWWRSYSTSRLTLPFLDRRNFGP